MSKLVTTNPLLTPYQLKHLTFKNRILSTAHSPNYVINGLPLKKYQLYHIEKAKGGIAMTMFGGSSNVSLDSPSVFGQIDMSNDIIIPHLQEFSTLIHEYDCKLMAQLTHMGRRTCYNFGDWLTPVAPSPIREPSHRAFPKELDEFEISRIVNDFSLAANRCKIGGIDGIELLASALPPVMTGHLIDQFWSPITNHRNDKYGGSIENRVRFCLEILEKCREVVDNDFIIGIRMGGDEECENGYNLEDGLKIADILVSSGMIDFLNINIGEIGTLSGLSKLLPNMSAKLSPHLDKVSLFKKEFNNKVGIFHACRIMDVNSAKDAIESGKLDMVGMTRAHIADPYIVNKLMNKNEHRIRPCVGAAYCIDRIYYGGEALCIHNASTGREELYPHIIEKAEKNIGKKIIIIGGGIAGLEAARICAERGHDVTLYEASSKLGGQVLYASKATWRKDLIGIIQWRIEELERLHVNINISCYIDNYNDILNDHSDVDIIICATGGIPNMNVISKENGQDLCNSIHDVLSGSLDIRNSNVIIYDNNGDHPALSCAEYLSDSKKNNNILFITPDRCVGFE